MEYEVTASELARRVREEAGTQLTMSGSVKVSIYVKELEEKLDMAIQERDYWHYQADPGP